MNIDQTLTAHRPSDDDLEGVWPSEDATLATVLRQLENEPAASPHRFTRRRMFALGGVAAAAAVALAVAPSVITPNAAPTATALDRLAATVAAQPAPIIPAGKYLHMVVHQSQDGVSGDPPAIHNAEIQESWIDADGTIWRHDTSWDTQPTTADYGDVETDAQGRRHSYLEFPADDRIAPTRTAWRTAESPTPAQAATLPAEVDTLRDYLLDNAGNAAIATDVDRDRYLFMTVQRLNSAGFVPPQVRSAALRLLGTLPEVTTTTRSPAGSVGTIRVAFHDPRFPGADLASTFAESSGEMLTLTASQAGSSFVQRFDPTSIVDEVPATVRSKARVELNPGERLIR